jgi:hypothetical protein
LLISSTGVITGFTLTLANGSERAALWDIVHTVRGLLIGDKGYLSSSLQPQLQAVGIQLETALRLNMPDQRDPPWVKLLMRVRRLIETVIGKLVERFGLKKFGHETRGT